MTTPPRARLAVAAVFLVVYAALLFTRLGEYALWDDEANTAIFGQSVWRTGDTIATAGDNIIAYGNGYELEGIYNRRLSPLQYYVVAPFVGLIGGTWGARLPFALAGFLLGVLAQGWLWSTRAPLSQWILVDLGFLGNVSLILYCRQSRYYALVILLGAVVTVLYARYDGSRAKLYGLAFSAAALLAANYLSYAAVALALGVDYVLFGSRRKAFQLRELATFSAIQLAFGLPLLATWNPTGKTLKNYVPQSWWMDKLELWWWCVRDLNSAELGALAILAAAPLLYFFGGRKDEALVRLPLGIVVAAGGIALYSFQTVAWNDLAETRYLIVLIPALILLSARVVDALPFPHEAWRYVFAVVLFMTNTLQVASATLIGSQHPEQWRSTIAAYVMELRDPPPSPYRAAIDWLEAHTSAGQTIYALPDWTVYPLMFHLPDRIYVWQFSGRQREEYPGLPAHHFRHLEPPDWMVAFASDVRDATRLIDRLAEHGADYRRAGAITDVHGKHRTRPELFLRSFTPKPVGDPETDGIYFFRRMSAPSGTTRLEGEAS